MEASSKSFDNRASRAALAAQLGKLPGKVLGGALMVSVTACGAADGSEWAFQGTEAVELGTLEAPLDGDWTPLTLINGWQSYLGARTPAVSIVNGVVTFRGALDGTNATSTEAFILPAAYRSPDEIYSRATMGVSSGGSLYYEPFRNAQQPTPYAVHVNQDGYSGLGPDAKSFTSLDGVSFDKDVYSATPVYLEQGWSIRYGHRMAGSGSEGGGAAYFTTVDGFVRFQGMLEGTSQSSTLLFNVPWPYRPSDFVYLPVTLCPGPNGSYGRLIVYPNGNVYVQAEGGSTLTKARCGTSLEGTSYAVASGGEALNLSNGWNAYSSRPVKVRNSGDIIRFEGDIEGGSSTTIAILPQEMRPSATVRIVADATTATEARILIQPSGVMKVTGAPLSTTSLFTSLDGVSFGL